eukprot:1803700-Rhodomonas_salina.1
MRSCCARVAGPCHCQSNPAQGCSDNAVLAAKSTALFRRKLTTSCANASESPATRQHQRSSTDDTDIRKSPSNTQAKKL